MDIKHKVGYPVMYNMFNEKKKRDFIKSYLKLVHPNLKPVGMSDCGKYVLCVQDPEKPTPQEILQRQTERKKAKKKGR